ncbi:MAG: TIGR04084 family radical SAM/SPASM domain-containing protein [Nitrososphaerota archaeon]
MLFIIYATGRCNLSCKYCGGSFRPNVVPWEVKYDVRLLADLADSSDVIAFYGGEPLLNQKFIKKVVEVLGNRTYVLQTNGLLLGELPPELLKVFDTILVSIDGVPSITDKYRGRGVYDKVVENVRMIHSMGYSGDIVARMTVNEDTDIYRDVSHLIVLGLFKHIHWQLNFVWTDKNAWRDPCSWVRNNYAPRLELLMNEWLRELKSGRIIGIVPFLGVLKRLLRHEDTAPPCGSGVDSFTILPDGRIISCPIAVTEEWALVGRLGETDRSELKKYKVHIDGPCINCSYYSACGGRCLYTHIEKLWGEVGDKAICSASRSLIDLVESRSQEIMRIIKEQRVSMDKILYPQYNNTVEIIP